MVITETHRLWKIDDETFRKTVLVLLLAGLSLIATAWMARGP